MANEGDFARLTRLFEQAVATDAAGRQALLKQVAAEDPALAERLAAMLAADAHDIDPLREAIAASARAAEPGTNLPARIGPFAVIQRLGAGGMGVVYLCRRTEQDFEQLLAVKRLPAAADSDFARQRLRIERSVLARLRHPNIAQLVDGGEEDDGTPFVAMEYVEGEAIDAYASRLQLGLRDRVKLFLALCDALQFAHRNLVVHRDIKAANVQIDRHGQLKLLDFGIAKLLTDAGDDDATPTVASTMTPHYASPEQVRGQPVGPASDIYSMGVLLYELLSGRRPYDLKTRSPAEMERIICETPPPPLPGRRVTDLDSIIACAMHKEPERRYASAAAFGEDLKRWLDDRPVEARRDSAVYRAQRFVRRHPFGTAASALIALLVIGFGSVMAWQAHQLALQRDAAELEAVKAVRVADFMEQLFEDVDPGKTQGAAITAGQLLSQGQKRLQQDFDTLPEVKARLLGVIGRTWRRLGEHQKARDVHERARQTLEQAEIDDPASDAQNRFDLAYADYRLGRLGEALAGHEAALALRRSIHDGDHADLANSLREVGLLRQGTGDLDGAAEFYEQAHAMYKRLGPDHASARAATLMDLAGIAMARGDLEKALLQAKHSLDVQLSLHGEIHPEVATATNNVSFILTRLNRLDESLIFQERSVRIRKQLYGPDNPITLRAAKNLAIIYWRLGMPARAAVLYRDAARDWLAEEPSEALPLSYFNLVNYGKILNILGEHQQVKSVIDALTEFAALSPDVQAFDRARVQELRGLWLRTTARPSQAAAHFRKAARWLRQDEADRSSEIERVMTFAAIADSEAAPDPTALDRLIAVIDRQLDGRERLPAEAGGYLAAIARAQAALGREAAAADTAQRLQAAVERIFKAGSLQHAAFEVQAAGWLIAAGRKRGLAARLDAAREAATKALHEVGQTFPLIEEIRADVSELQARLDG